MLSALTDEYESWMNARLDDEDALLSEIVNTVADKSDEINATLNEVSDEYGTMISDTITSIFSTDSPFTTALTNGLYDVSNNTVGAVNSVNSTLGKGFTDANSAIAGTTTAINSLIEKVSNITNVMQKTNAGTNSPSPGGSPGNTSNTTSLGNGINSYTPVYTPPAPSVPQSNTQNSVQNSSSSVDGIFIHKTDSYPKDKLQTETSIVD